MNTRILLSVLIIVAVVAGVSAVTFAFFSDQGTSTGNVFESGTIILKLSDSNETAVDDVTATIGGSNMVPGDVLSGTLNIKNTGTHEANHVDVAVANTSVVNNLDRVLELTALDYDGSSILSQVVPDGNANGYKDLADLAASDLSALALTDLNVNHPLYMQVTFRTDAGNEYQGGSVTTNWTITLNQDSTQ